MKGLLSNVLSRRFARRVVRNLPKMRLNENQKISRKTISIDNYLMDDTEAFLSRLIKSAKNQKKIIEIFEENSEDVNPRDACFALKSFLVKKNERTIKNFDKVGKIELDQREKKFIEICFEKILGNLEKLEIREINTILKITSILGLLDTDKNLSFFEYYRDNDEPFNYYAALDLLELFLEEEERGEELEYLTKNLGIVISYDAYMPKDAKLCARMLGLMLRSPYCDVSILVFLEEELKSNNNTGSLEIEDILNVMVGYDKNEFKGPDYDLLDVFSSLILEKNMQEISVRDVKRLLEACRSLKYDSGNLLNALGKWIFNYVNNPTRYNLGAISDGTEHIEGESTANDQDEGQSQISVLKKTDHNEVDYLVSCLYSLLYLDYCNNEVYNSVLMRTTMDLESASPKILYMLCFCHSKFTFLRMKEVEEGQEKYYKRSVKALQRLNDQFYEMTLPIIKQKIPNFHPLDLVSIVFCAQRPEVKKLAVKRDILDLGLLSLDHFAQIIQAENPQISDINAFKKSYLQMIEVSNRFAYNDKQKKAIESKIEEHRLNMRAIKAKYGMYSIKQ